MFIIPQEDANLEEVLLLTVPNHRFPPNILIQIINVHFQVQILPRGDVNHKEYCLNRYFLPIQYIFIQDIFTIM